MLILIFVSRLFAKPIIMRHPVGHTLLTVADKQNPNRQTHNLVHLVLPDTQINAPQNQKS